MATIDWTPPMTLTLVVVHADGRPASDAAVGLRRDLEPVRDPLSEAARLAGGTASLRAGPDGRAEQVLTPGRYRIHAQAGLGYATFGPLEVAPGDPPRIVQLALRPLEGAALLRLRLRPEPGSSRVNAWSPERPEARFGAVAHRGSPLELLVPAGRYTVELSGSGLRTQRWDQDLAPGEVRELERAGLPGWPLSGRVLLPRPVVGGLSQIGGEQAYAEVGQDGRFSFAWLGEEQCELRFFASGYATRAFSVRAGEGEQTLDYGPVTTFVCRSASLTGWAVVEWPAGRVEGSFDEDGRFSVPRLPVGARARVMLGGNGPVRTAEVRVTGAGPIEVDLPPPALLGPLRLSVLDADGEPLLGGVHVVVRVARQTLRLSTDEFGRWGDVLPCGRLELAVGREDLGLEHRTLEHPPAGTAVEVRLPRGPSLRGKVTGTLPAGGAYVSLAPAGWAGEALRWADVLADGSFGLGRVAPGDWAVTLIEDSGSRTLEARTVTVLPEPDEHVVEFVLGG
ncbi:MAG: hypothetical protein R3F62_21490 [Planctomycetota bacterium]